MFLGGPVLPPLVPPSVPDLSSARPVKNFTLVQFLLVVGLICGVHKRSMLVFF